MRKGDLEQFGHIYTVGVNWFCIYSLSNRKFSSNYNSQDSLGEAMTIKLVKTNGHLSC